MSESKEKTNQDNGGAPTPPRWGCAVEGWFFDKQQGLIG